MSDRWRRVEPSIEVRAEGPTEYKVTYRPPGETNPTSRAGFPTLAAARQFKADMAKARHEARHDQGYDARWTPKNETPLLRDWMETYIARLDSPAPNTLRAYRKAVGRIDRVTQERGRSWLLDKVRVGQLEFEHTRQLKAALEPHYAPATVRYTLRMLAAAHRYAIDPERMIPITQRFTFPEVSLPKRRFTHTPTDFAKLFAEVNPRYKAAVYTAAHTGLRTGELAGLTIDSAPCLAQREGQWVVLEDQPPVLIIRQQLQMNYDRLDDPRRLTVLKSTASDGDVRLPYRGFAILADHLNHFGPGATVGDGQTLLFGSSGKHNIMTHKLLWLQVTGASERALGKRVRPHDLRHLFLSMANANGADWAQIAALARHGSIRTSMDTYVHVFRDQVSAVVDAVHHGLDQALIDSGVVLPLFRDNRSA